MGKRFDAKAVMGYCDTMSDAYTTYGQAADNVQYACTAFADNTTFTGRQAEVTKELVGTVEVGLMDEILAVNGRIKGAQNNIMEMFASDVDAASNARIDEDVLTGINEDLRGYADSFEAIGKQVESIYSRLLKFSKYGSFTKPDFSSGRAAASALCGGSGNVGFVHECIQRLRDYDTDATAMLDGMGLGDAMSDIASRISRSSTSMRSYQIYKAGRGRFYAGVLPLTQYGPTGAIRLSTPGQREGDKTATATRAELNRLEEEALKKEIDKIGEKIKDEVDPDVGNVFDVDPSTINTTGVVEVSHWDVDPSVFEPKERAKLPESSDYYAKMTPEMQRITEKMYRDYLATEGRIEDEERANNVANIMARHYRVTGDTRGEAEAVKLQTRTAGRTTAFAAGMVDALIVPFDAVGAAANALTGQKGFVESWNEMQAAHDFSDLQEQHPVAYFGGKVTGSVMTYHAANATLSSVPGVSNATSKAGNAIAQKAGSVLPRSVGKVVGGAGKNIGNVLQGTIADVVLDTLPTELSNAASGMSAGEILLDTGKNVGGNILFNAIGEVAPAVLKAAGERHNAANSTSSQSVRFTVIENTRYSFDADYSGEEWCRYLRDLYGSENVVWENATPSQLARSWQGVVPYEGVDEYIDVKVKSGSVLFRGEPNGSEYFTTLEAIESVDAIKENVFQGLQVREDPLRGYRSQMVGYLLKDECDAAMGKAVANTKYGDGGLTQFFVPSAQRLIDNGVLIPMYVIELK